MFKITILLRETIFFRSQRAKYCINCNKKFETFKISVLQIVELSVFLIKQSEKESMKKLS